MFQILLIFVVGCLTLVACVAYAIESDVAVRSRVASQLFACVSGLLWIMYVCKLIFS